MTEMFRALATIFAAFVCLAGPALAAPPPLEAYGQKPRIVQIDLSPDGEKIAILIDDGEREVLMIRKTTGEAINGIDSTAIRVRDIEFLTDDTVIVRASESTNFRNTVRGRTDFSGAFAVNIYDPKPHQLLKRYRDLWPLQNSMARIIAVSPDGRYVYMPTYASGSAYAEPRLDVVRVALKDGKANRTELGNQLVFDWFVDENGKEILREEYSNLERRYVIKSEIEGGNKTLLEVRDSDIPRSGITGFTPDRKHIIFYRGRDLGRASYVLMSPMDGTIGEDVFAGSKDIYWIIKDENRLVHGVQFAGMRPSYEFFDKALDADMQAFIDAVPDHTVQLEGWSRDWSRLLLYLEGPEFSGSWFIFDRNTQETQYLASRYDTIPDEAVVDMEVYTYKARDGLTIEAVLTGAAADGEAPKPLIVMPHGGPASHDTIVFDWLAQFMASRGYTIFQPNFRGSTGYGLDFQLAGQGEWGGAMQDDITDGVEALIADGIAERGNICIVGASYGGYAALMGGAKTPDLFRCVIAIAPVTDLNQLMRSVRERAGRDSVAYRAMLEEFDVRNDRDGELKAASPERLADQFKAPVLLIHGKDDAVVPVDHSRDMRRALERAGKPVEYIELKGEDHFLSLNETRIATLQAIERFLAQHLPASPR